jgi:hypothetical protein
MNVEEETVHRFSLLEEVMNCKLQELIDPGSHLYIPTVN